MDHSVVAGCVGCCECLISGREIRGKWVHCNNDRPILLSALQLMLVNQALLDRNLMIPLLPGVPA